MLCPNTNPSSARMDNPNSSTCSEFLFWYYFTIKILLLLDLGNSYVRFSFLENCGNGVISTVTTTRNISATNGRMGDLIAASSSLGFNEQVYYIGVPPELDLKERKMGNTFAGDSLCNLPSNCIDWTGPLSLTRRDHH